MVKYTYIMENPEPTYKGSKNSFCNISLKYNKEDFNEKVDSYYDTIIKSNKIVQLYYDYDLNLFDGKDKLPYDGFTWNKWDDRLKGLREFVKSLTEIDKKRQSARNFVINIPYGHMGANPSGYTGGELIVIEKAVLAFNAGIPTNGVQIMWGTEKSESGILWGLDWKNKVLSAKITTLLEEKFPNDLRINGVRKIKKTDNVLSELVIERLYTVDRNGNEFSIFLTI